MYKKYIITNITNVDPTINDNIAAGYTLGQEWFNELTGEKFLHKSDGVWLVAGIGITEVTYDELLALKTGSELVANQTYLLTDYETIWNDTFISLSFSSGVTEPLYITATDVDKLSNECRSKLYPQDIVYYEITGDIGNGEGTEGFTKGKIYRRIDTLRNNDIGTDWRHITYRRYAFNVTDEYTVGNSYVKGDVVDASGVIWVCVINDPNSSSVNNGKWARFTFYNGSLYSEKRSSGSTGYGIYLTNLSVIIPADPLDFEDVTMFPEYNNPGYSILNNTIETYKLHNSIIYYNCRNNKVGGDFIANTIYSMVDNKLSRSFRQNNIIELKRCTAGISAEGSGFELNSVNIMDSNQLHGRFSDNFISGVFKWNTIGEDFMENVIKSSFNTNIVERGAMGNLITTSDVNFSNNKLGVEFTNNTITTSVNRCTFGIYNTNLNLNSNFTIVNWNFGNDIDGSTIALPELGEEYTKKLVNANGTYIIEYIDEYGDDIIADQLASFAFRSNQESLNIYGYNSFSTLTLIDWGDASVWTNTSDSFNETHAYTGKLNTDEISVRIASSNMYYISLENNQITFFDPINLPITLTSLRLNSNQIVTFDPINLHNSLTDLNLNYNQITSFDTSNLPGFLQSLSMQGNQITDFNPSIALPNSLIYLYLDSNQIITFDPTIALPNLLDLGLGGNQIVTFDPSNHPLPSSLYYLYLGVNQIVTFDPANYPLPNSLWGLNLVENQIVTFDPANYPLPSSLERLRLNGNQIVNFDPANYPLPSSLRHFELTSNQIVTFDPANYPLPSLLQVLSLNNNQIVTFNPTNYPLPNSLTNITLGYNQLTSFNPSLALPSSLYDLNLEHNQIVTFDPSNHGLPNSLRYLGLSFNQIVTFNPSVALPNGLIQINLSSNQLTSFNPVLPLPSSLTQLYLYGNQLSTAEVNNTLVMLNARYTTPGSKQFNLLFMSPPAPPSGAGIAAKTALQSKGYTVITD